MSDEEWKTPPSLPDYEVSSFGRVRRKTYLRSMPKGGLRSYGGEPHFGVWAKDQRRRIFVYKSRTYKVHRLVCEAFNGPQPHPKSVVMHINEDSNDNRPENLCWGTQKENLNAPGFVRYCKGRTGGNSPVRKSALKKNL
jgi:hypothetical protein